MAEKILNTRIVLKNDTYEKWTSSSLPLKKGEVALASVSTTKTNGDYEVPTYLMKVGDGTHTFSELKWLAASAADVYSWAKQQELPIEVSGSGNGIDNVEFKKTELHTKGAIVITKTNFEAAGAAASALSSANAHSDKNLKSAKSYADQAEADAVSTAAADATSKAGTAESNAKGHADDLNTKMDTRVKALETAIGEGGSVDAQIDAKINLLDVKAVTAETGYVISSVGQENGKVIAAKKQLTAADIPSLTVAKISDYATDVEKKITAKGYATKSEAQGYADAKDSAIAAAKKAGTDAQGTADTAVANAATAQSKANTADKHAVDAQTRVSAIENDYLKNVDKTELTEADAAQVERIAALEGKIDGVTGAMHFKGTKPSVPENTSGYKDGDVILVGNKEYVASGEAFVELGDTTQEGKDITNLKSRMTTAEGKLATIQGDGAGSINKALADAKSYTDGKVSDLADGQVKANTGAIATNTVSISTNSGNISKNTKAIEAINNLDTGILAKAKAHADSLDTTMDGRVDKIEAKVAGWDEAASKANSAVQSVVEGDVNGTIKVDGTAVNVHGLGSAAYTDKKDYATAAQGKKADSALQEVTTTPNGGLKVTGKNKINIDEAITFVFDCGDANDNPTLQAANTLQF